MEKLRTFLRNQKINKLLCTLIGIASLVYAGSVIPKNFIISPTGSVGYHVFFSKRQFRPSEIRKGALVVIPFYTKIRPHCWPCLVVKYIRCDSGQKLDVRNGREFFCNNVFLGQAKTHSKKGVPVKIFQYNGIIPKGKFFAMGTSIDSYDSRYVGLENKNDVKALAIPVF